MAQTKENSRGASVGLPRASGKGFGGLTCGMGVGKLRGTTQAQGCAPRESKMAKPHLHTNPPFLKAWWVSLPKILETKRPLVQCVSTRNNLQAELNTTYPAFSGVPRKGDQIRSGYITPAFLGVPIVGGHEQETKGEPLHCVRTAHYFLD